MMFKMTMEPIVDKVPVMMGIMKLSMLSLKDDDDDDDDDVVVMISNCVLVFFYKVFYNVRRQIVVDHELNTTK